MEEKKTTRKFEFTEARRAAWEKAQAKRLENLRKKRESESAGQEPREEPTRLATPEPKQEEIMSTASEELEKPKLKRTRKPRKSATSDRTDYDVKMS